MGRVAIIGNAGGGKTTLARKLGQRLRIKVYPIDLIQWKPGWQPATFGEIKQRHDAILAEERWVIDGWGPWELIGQRFASADTIILIDLPLYWHYWWASKRQLRSVFRERDDLPENCPMLPRTRELFRLIKLVQREYLPKVRTAIAEHREGRELFLIRSPRELRRFIRSYC